MIRYSRLAVLLPLLLLTACDQAIEDAARDYCVETRGCQYVKPRKCLCNGGYPILP